MPPLPPLGYWHSLLARHGRIWKAAYKEVTRALESKVVTRGPAQVEYATARVSARQPVHPIARLRQAKSGWARHLHTAARYFTTESAGARNGASRAGSSYASATWSVIKQSPGRAPFASTLRPNLTGGTLGRTAGGYSLGGGRAGAQRYFSHGPASQTQVVQNVSQAMRAFLLGGQKAQYNGVDPKTGNKRFKAVTKLQHDAGSKMRAVPRTTPGSYVRFNINPTVTALTPLHKVTGFEASIEQHLNADGLLDVLSADFSRSLKELAAVLTDLRRLAALGDLPITCIDSSLRIHFPGCDADTVENLCSELNVKRGLVVQDQDFDAFAGTEMALLFPFAPSEAHSVVDDLFEEAPVKHRQPSNRIDWQDLMTPEGSSARYSTQSETGMEESEEDDPWLSSPEEGCAPYGHSSEDGYISSRHTPLEYQGIEGIYRFIEQCDNAQRR